MLKKTIVLPLFYGLVLLSLSLLLFQQSRLSSQEASESEDSSIDEFSGEREEEGSIAQSHQLEIAERTQLKPHKEESQIQLSPQPFHIDLLEDYGKGSPEEDLDIIASCMETYRRFVRNQPRTLPPATNNRIFTKALTGANIERLMIIDSRSSIISSEGELLDRWGNPIILHFVSSESIGIRSAGIDGVPYSSDDIVREAEKSIGMVKKG